MADPNAFEDGHGSDSIKVFVTDTGPDTKWNTVNMFPSRALWDAISQPFKQAQTGLYQGKMKQYGNNVPFSYKKTRRTWLPNVHSKRLPSVITGGMLRVKLTTRALRTIKKKGGLDNYLKTTSADILGDAGMRLRIRLLDAGRRKTRNGPRDYKVLSPEELAAKKTRERKTVRLNMPASLETARYARTLAAKALGHEQPASVEETITFLKELAAKRENRRAMLLS